MGAEPPLMRDRSGALDQDSRCDAGLVFCLVAAVQATRGSDFDTPFGQAIRRAASRDALSILLEWGFSPSNSPAAAAWR